ncbi:facilitated trehalose transporter Tret1-like [Bacillus rossius redtenbacheri]|uniref:facilitated trehalose transporter Tret1-like n=1 Tax=Bacillus rossius redtenbacheri TaxID=93214 RepID=UPI002FDDAE04
MDDPKILTSTNVLVPSDDKPARRLRQYIAALSATLGAFSLGTVLAWTSPTSSQLAQSDTNHDPRLMTQAQWSWVSSLMNVGATLSVVLVGAAIDRIGRKYTMLALVLPFVAGWFMIAWADQDVPLYYVGRIVCGMMGGAFSLSAPVYISEIAQKEIRGMLGVCYQLMLTVGILFVYVVGGIDGVSVFALTLTCSFIPLVFGAIFFFMPETPRQYIQKGRMEEARQSLTWFRGEEYNIDAEIQEIETAVETTKALQLSWRESFSTPAAKKALLVSLGLMIFQQLSGVNAVIFYSSDIFKDAGSTLAPSKASIVIGVIQVIATFISTQVVDRAGRRPLLMASHAVMSACAITLGVYFHVKEDVAGIGWLPLASLCVYIVLFSFGVGPIPWLMVGELFPAGIKGAASSVACLVNWLLSFVVTKFFVDMVASIGPDWTFWIFGAVLAVGTAFVYFVVPETKGKTLEEIQADLGGDKRKRDPEELKMPHLDRY